MLGLLYLEPEENAVSNDSVVYDLSLDRAFEYIEPDNNRRREFLKILTNPPKNINNIRARQQTLRDFISNQLLLDELTDAVRRYSDAHKDFSHQRGALVTSSRINDESARSSLIVSASHLYEQLKRLKNISSVLHRYKLYSPLLQRVCCRLYALTEEHKETYDAMSSLMSRLRNITAEDSFTVTAHLTGDCRLSGCELSAITDCEIGGGIIGRLFGKNPLKGKLPQPNNNNNTLENSEGLRNSLLGEGFRETMTLVSSITASLYSEFEGLMPALEFYTIAIDYVRMLRHKGLPAVFPEICERPALDCRGLYDILLCFEQPNASGVVPNDMFLDDTSDGIIIRGENNSGKTVFLRSAGSAALLAQNGLPIPCDGENASCGIFGGIFTQFAAAEKEFEAGNDAGRFEQEVRELAAVIDKAVPDSLVLLNESFQTTAYSEGADGMYHILKYLTSQRIKWVIVTHLPELAPMFGDGNVVRMRTVEGYKLEKVNEL